MLDGIRGIAVLIVLASHADALGMHGQGSLGVMLFFVLSGYVLSLPYVENPRKIRSHSEVARYFINRILRLAPVFWLAVLLITWLKSESVGWFFLNASFYAGWSHLWSVAEEARFYVLFPLVLWMLSITSSRLAQMMVVLSLLILFYFLRQEHQIDMLTRNKTVNFYFWVFLAGIFACQMSQLTGPRRMLGNPGIKLGFCLVAVLCVVFIVASSDDHVAQIVAWIDPMRQALPRLNGWAQPELWTGLFCVLLITSTRFPAFWLSRSLSLFAFRHVGLLSYSIYLFHMPVMLHLKAWFQLRELTLFLATLAISYLIAWLTYILLEKPFLGLKKKIPLPKPG